MSYLMKFLYLKYFTLRLYFMDLIFKFSQLLSPIFLSQTGNSKILVRFTRINKEILFCFNVVISLLFGNILK